MKKSIPQIDFQVIIHKIIVRVEIIIFHNNLKIQRHLLIKKLLINKINYKKEEFFLTKLLKIIIL